MSKNTGFDQIIEENSIGQTIDFSKEGLKIGIVNLLSQRDRWEEMARVEKTLYQSHYSWQLMKSRIKELYSTL